ncbi:MAG: Fe-S cluster assembly protein HesB [Candidatus Cohnella colombiensis]|uniref:Fe-S cluster assembly protein HesB n=1 Tax=Candidatus Cohnella colombiensis TaxID=3121368 RepID=A0AA95EY45_9BACL|nr:MAG: Fe-S cluster assembly protein HesB [Cohnella sp.]
MDLVITPTALDCFKEEWGFDEGEMIRIFVRYVSGGEVPFAFGIIRDTPHDVAVTRVAEHLTFYMEHKDVWFLEGKSLTIDCHGDGITFDLA